MRTVVAMAPRVGGQSGTRDRSTLPVTHH